MHWFFFLFLWVYYTIPFDFSYIQWYRCEAMGQSNQVDQHKLLQKIALIKICEFCEDMSKSKKKCKSFIINHIPWLKCLIFRCFWVELCKNLENDGKEIKISTHINKLHFWVKYAVFVKNENEFSTKIWFWMKLKVVVGNRFFLWLVYILFLSDLNLIGADGSGKCLFRFRQVLGWI